MKKLTRFVAVCVLVLSTSAITFADGGNTQGPGCPEPPPPPGNTQGPGMPTSSTAVTELPTAPDTLEAVAQAAQVWASWFINNF